MYEFGERIWLMCGPLTLIKKRSACGNVRYATVAPSANRRTVAAVNGNGVLLLVRLEAGRDETPQLEEQDRKRDEDPAVGRHVEPERKALKGVVM